MSSNEGGQHPLSSSGGLRTPLLDLREPFEVLDDLMQVVEALCPTWPHRDLFRDAADFKL